MMSVTLKSLADRQTRLFAGSAVLMMLAMAVLGWLYSVVNGKELGGLRKGGVTGNARSGNVKGQ